MSSRLSYQIDLVRSTSQRQSELSGSSTQHGLPIAPAKWTVLLSTEITRSIAAICAVKGSRYWNGSTSRSQCTTWPVSVRRVSRSRLTSPYCSEMKAQSGVSKIGFHSDRSIERMVALSRLPLRQEMPTRRLPGNSARYLLRSFSAKAGSGMRWPPRFGRFSISTGSSDSRSPMPILAR